MSCRIAVLISGNGSNLQALIEACASGQVDGSLCVVISNQLDAFGLERARRAGIPTAVVEHRQFSSRDAFDRELASTLEAFHPDLVLLAGFMRILTPQFVQQFHGRLLNIHPSLLPKYRGLDTHQRALDAGDREAGATVHFVTEELDGGPAIIQARVPILPDDNAEQLAERVQREEHQIYPMAASWFASGRLRLDGGQACLDGHPLPASGHLRDETATC